MLAFVVMEPTPELDLIECPACGGAGGGPFGRAGSAWDDESYVCPRCKGRGALTLEELTAKPATMRPGIVKAVPGQVQAPAKKKQA